MSSPLLKLACTLSYAANTSALRRIMTALGARCVLACGLAESPLAQAQTDHRWPFAQQLAGLNGMHFLGDTLWCSALAVALA